jgi:hypothetical protein
MPRSKAFYEHGNISLLQSSERPPSEESAAPEANTSRKVHDLSRPQRSMGLNPLPVVEEVDEISHEEREHIHAPRSSSLPNATHSTSSARSYMDKDLPALPQELVSVKTVTPPKAQARTGYRKRSAFSISHDLDSDSQPPAVGLPALPSVPPVSGSSTMSSTAGLSRAVDDQVSPTQCRVAETPALPPTIYSPAQPLQESSHINNRAGGTSSRMAFKEDIFCPEDKENNFPEDELSPVSHEAQSPDTGNTLLARPTADTKAVPNSAPRPTTASTRIAAHMKFFDSLQRNLAPEPARPFSRAFAAFENEKTQGFGLSKGAPEPVQRLNLKMATHADTPHPSPSLPQSGLKGSDLNTQKVPVTQHCSEAPRASPASDASRGKIEIYPTTREPTSAVQSAVRKAPPDASQAECGSRPVTSIAGNRAASSGASIKDVASLRSDWIELNAHDDRAPFRKRAVVAAPRIAELEAPLNPVRRGLRRSSIMLRGAIGAKPEDQVPELLRQLSTALIRLSQLGARAAFRLVWDMAISVHKTTNMLLEMRQEYTQKGRLVLRRGQTLGQVVFDCSRSILYVIALLLIARLGLLISTLVTTMVGNVIGAVGLLKS